MKSRLFIYPLLSFLLAACQAPDNSLPVKKNKKGGFYEVVENGKQLSFYNSEDQLTVDTVSCISFDYFEKVGLSKPEYPNNYLLNFILSDTGAIQLEKMTARNIQKTVCLVIDDKIMAAPTVQEPIKGGKIDMVMPDEKEARYIFDYLTK